MAPARQADPTHPGPEQEGWVGASLSPREGGRGTEGMGGGPVERASLSRVGEGPWERGVVR